MKYSVRCNVNVMYFFKNFTSKIKCSVRCKVNVMYFIHSTQLKLINSSQSQQTAIFRFDDEVDSDQLEYPTQHQLPWARIGWVRLDHNYPRPWVRHVQF